MVENTGAKQPRRGVGKPFAPGRSGNPKGKPLGARHRVTLAVEQLLDGEAEAITRQCVEMAKAGDGMALRLIMERIAPLRRGRPVNFELPETDGAVDITRAHSAVLRACAAGELTLEEGTLIAAVLEAKRRSIETDEIVRRLAALEQAQNERGAP